MMMKSKNEEEPSPMEIHSRESLHVSQSRRKSSKRSSSEEKPNPLNFEAFLPWVCKQWQCPKPVIVRRMIQQKYVNVEDRKATLKTKRSSRQNYDLVSDIRRSDDSKASKTPQITSLSKASQITSLSKTSEGIEYAVNETVEESVIVTAYYDFKNHLVKVTFTNASEVPRKVIQGLSLCLPYHPLLTNFTFNGLTTQNLYEISKLLPHSNITQIRLSDCFIPEANYFVLLEQTYELKFLSLSRCSVNDLGCKELVERLEVGMSGSPLSSLELDSNCITDVGAEYIAKVLRLNRSLLHLNLSGNQLTDKGADMILTQLAEFPLTDAEILDRRQRKMKYSKNKFAIYQRFSEELRQKRINMRSDNLWSPNVSFLRQKDSFNSNKSLESRKIKDSKKPTADLAENAAMDIAGEFTDPFEDTGIIKRNGYPFYIGNQVLCSLNLAYNNLSYFSVKRIHEVLKYQQQTRQCFGKTGLQRISFEGNSVPKDCVEYGQIDLLLEAILDRTAPVLSKNIGCK